MKPATQGKAEPARARWRNSRRLDWLMRPGALFEWIGDRPDKSNREGGGTGRVDRRPTPTGLVLSGSGSEIPPDFLDEDRIMTIVNLAAILGLALVSAQGPEAEKHPNVILIIADDLAVDDTGAFGNSKIRTPNIDELARGGMRFDRAFVTASSCSPSRSSMITGRYPHNTGAEELHWPLPPDQITFVEKLKASGYWTAAAGKWHLGNPIKPRFDLVKEGSPAAFQLRIAKDANARMTAEGSGAVQAGCDQWVPVLRDRPKGKPFFLWLAAFDPHRDYEEGTIPQPHRPEDVVVPPYLPDVPEVRKDLALYYDEISRLDRYVGEVMAELARQGEADNTLVLFLSDNGRPFPRCKTTLYDSGIRTPLIARWPGHIEAGTRSSSLVSTVNLAPTILKLAGVAPGPDMRGRDLSPIFKDPSAKVRDQVFAERNWHDYASRGRAVRSERFKYIKNDDFATPLTPPSDAVRSLTYRAMQRLRDEGKLDTAQRACFAIPRPKEELYDVEADPHELVNLAGDPKYDEVLAGLRRDLAEWARGTNDVAPETLTPDEFDRETGEPFPNRARPRLPKPKPTAAAVPKAAPAKPVPTRADVAYGPSPHQVLDVYVPPGGKGPFPVVLWFGGLWAPSKNVPDLKRFHEAHCAVVGVEMRVMGEAKAEKVDPPVSICLLDARRALQFVRLNAESWGLDPARIAVAGGSQGALPALYLGCSGEGADPTSADPVARVSTKVACVGAWRSQPSIDPRRMQEWVPGVEWGTPAFGCSFAEALRRRDEFLPIITRWSPDALVDKHAAPIFFENNWGMTRPETVQEADYRVHSPAWALGFQDLARRRGAVCYVKFPDHPSEKFADMWEFLFEKLKETGPSSRD